MSDNQTAMLRYVNEQTEYEEKEARLDRKALLVSMQAIATGSAVDGEEFVEKLEKELKSRNLVR